MVMMIFIAIQTVVGGILASNFIGEEGLAASNIALPYISTVLAVAIMFATGSNAIIAKNLGEKDANKARENFTRIVLTGVGTAIVMAIITLSFSTEIVTISGATPQLLDISKAYLTADAFVIVLVFLSTFGEFFFVTAGKQLYAMIAISVGTVLNIITTYLLIAVFEVGIIAVPIGLGVGNSVLAILFVVYFTFNKKGYLYFVKPKMHKKFMLNTCTNGSSEMVTNLAISVVAAVTNIIMGSLAGEDGISAASVNAQVQFLLNSVFIGFGAGVAPVFAYAYGEQNKEQTKRVFWICVRFVAILSVVFAAIGLFASDYVISLFLDPAGNAYAMSSVGFKIFSFSFIFAGMNILTSVFFTSVSNGKISALVSFLRTFLFIIGALMTLPAMLGVTGVWLAVPIAEVLAIVVSILLLKKYRKTYHF